MPSSTLTFILFCIALISSCTPILYAPAPQNVSFLKEKGEASASFGYVFTQGSSKVDFKVDGFSAQIAAAVGEHTGVNGTFLIMAEKENSLDSWYGNGNFVELGVGRFGSFGEENNGLIECYAGIGIMSIKNKLDDSYINVKIIKPYIQPSIGTTSKNIDFAFTPRFSTAHYTTFEYALSDPDHQSEAIRFQDKKKSSFVFEPGFTVQVGFNNTKVRFQYIYSTFKYDPLIGEAGYAPYHRNFFSFGLNFFLTDRYE